MSNQRLLKSGAITLGAFGAVSAFFQVLVLPLPYRIATFVTTLLCGGGAILLMRRVHAHRNALDALLRLLPPSRASAAYAVRHINDIAELRELWEIDNQSYGEASISLGVFEDWWRRYPAGLFALFRGDEIVGGIGIWPLRKTPFLDLLHGRRRERELIGQSIETGSKALGCSRWYVSGIVLVHRARKTEAVRILLREAIRQWVTELRSASAIDLCAMAYSSEGEVMLRRFGFHKFKDRTETLDKFPMFALLSATPPEIEKRVARLSK